MTKTTYFIFSEHQRREQDARRSPRMFFISTAGLKVPITNYGTDLDRMCPFNDMIVVAECPTDTAPTIHYEACT